MTNILEFNSYQPIPVALTGLLSYNFYNLIPDNFSGYILRLNEDMPARLRFVKLHQNYYSNAVYLNEVDQGQFLQTQNFTLWHKLTKLKGDKDFFVVFHWVPGQNSKSCWASPMKSFVHGQRNPFSPIYLRNCFCLLRNEILW